MNIRTFFVFPIFSKIPFLPPHNPPPAIYSHEDTIFCKTPIMKTIDKEYESVVEAIETRERDILRQLQEFVYAESSAISKLVGQVARVDALLALANFAHKCNLVKPEMIDRG